MRRVLLIALLGATAACGTETGPVQSAPAAPALFRASVGEVRLRCGSQLLRARLRNGQVLAQVDNSGTTVLAPVQDPRAESGPAFSDGTLTLYRVPKSDSWALANGSGGGAPCKGDAAP